MAALRSAVLVLVGGSIAVGCELVAGLSLPTLVTDAGSRFDGTSDGGICVPSFVQDPPALDEAVFDASAFDATSPSFTVALQAFENLHALENRYRRIFNEGQTVFRRWLANEPLVKTYKNFGAVFECLRLPDGVDADELNDLLVTEYDTQIVPGRFFGLVHHVRLSTGLPAADLEEALWRVSRALRRIIEGGR